MTEFKHKEADAHREAINSELTTVYIYEYRTLLNGLAYIVTDRKDLVPRGATATWLYQKGIPSDIRPRAVEANG